MRTSVRARLLAIALLPLALALPALLLLLFYWGDAYYDRLVFYKADRDLALADQLFQRMLDRVGRDVRGVAQSHALADALRAGDAAEVGRMLAWKGAGLKLDFLVYHAGTATPDTEAWAVMRRALSGDDDVAIDVFAAEQLGRIDPDLARRARLDLPAPAGGKPDGRAMVMHAAVPVFDDHGRQSGVLEAGLLLNRNQGLVDALNAMIYRPDSLVANSRGTVTLFLDDRCIATDERLFEGRPGLGIPVARTVRERVLGRGETWRDRALVADDWYVSGYQPIRDSRGERVGMLYAGYQEKPFRDAQAYVLAAILLLFTALGAGGGWLCWRWARTIFQPLERMDATIAAVEAGRPEARTGVVDTADEIGRVAERLDKLLDLQDQRKRELQAWGEALDQKVAERTEALTDANRRLQDTQRQLILAEKLAAIGELTAGVAHEINNPIAVMQGNLDLMRDLLGPAAAPVREEIRLLDGQIQRIQSLVGRLLQFARPADYAGYVEAVDVNELVQDCLVLVRHQIGKGNIAVAQDLRASQRVGINRNELQQVLINLMVNALHAMPDAGTLTLASADRDGGGVNLTVADTGSGIAPDDLPRIFDPFFTTRKTDGNGLGLSICYTIVARYGGTIAVESAPGRGSAFTVRLLGEPPPEEAGPASAHPGS
ncbi:MAG: two-component sensor histidine kinase [Thiobacillus sp.]|nr:two-component sensor histidine kinase [Thiobacillus sp.]